MLGSLLTRSRYIRVPRASGTIDLQRVSVKQKPRRPIALRLLATFLATSVTITTLSHVGATSETPRSNGLGIEKPRIEKDGLKKTPTAGPAGTSRAMANFASYNIVIPIWIRKTRGPRYTPQDPEWKAYQALHQDPGLMSRVKAMVVGMTAKEVRLLQGQLLDEIGSDGTGPAYMALHLTVPRFRTLYQVPCLRLVPGQSLLGWHNLPDSVGSKFDRALHPVVFANAFYLGLKEFCLMSYLITKARISARWGSAATNTAATGGREPIDETMTKQSAHFHRLSEAMKKAWLPFLRGEYGQDASRQGYRHLVRSMTYLSAIESGCATFRATWSFGQARAMSLNQIQGECCQIKGTVVFFGPRGKLHVDVAAIYSSATNSILGRPVITRSYIVADSAKWYERLSGLKGAAVTAKAPSPTSRSSEDNPGVQSTRSAVPKDNEKE